MVIIWIEFGYKHRAQRETDEGVAAQGLRGIQWHICWPGPPNGLRSFKVMPLACVAGSPACQLTWPPTGPAGEGLVTEKDYETIRQNHNQKHVAHRRKVSVPLKPMDGRSAGHRVAPVPLPFLVRNLTTPAAVCSCVSVLWKDGVFEPEGFDGLCTLLSVAPPEAPPHLPHTASPSQLMGSRAHPRCIRSTCGTDRSTSPCWKKSVRCSKR